MAGSHDRKCSISGMCLTLVILFMFLRLTFSVKYSYFDIRHQKQFPEVKHLSWNVLLQHLVGSAVKNNGKVGPSLSQHYAKFDINHTCTNPVPYLC